MSTSPRHPPPPNQALLAFRIIGASLGLGVTFFAAVAWLVRQDDGPVAEPPIDHDILVNVLIGVAALAIVVSILFWRARIAPLIRRAGAAAPRSGQLQTNVIICWAMMEAPAMLAVAVYFLYGDVVAALAGIALIWLTLALTWPKRAWVESL